MLKKGGWGSWDDPLARATRGRGLPSLDARSRDHPTHPLQSDRSLRPRWTAFLSILLSQLLEELQLIEMVKFAAYVSGESMACYACKNGKSSFYADPRGR